MAAWYERDPSETTISTCWHHQGPWSLKNLLRDPFVALRISVGSDGGEEVPVGFPRVEEGPDSVVREVG